MPSDFVLGQVHCHDEFQSVITTISDGPFGYNLHYFLVESNTPVISWMSVKRDAHL